MSSNNIAHVSSVDKGLKMKIKRTKMPNKLDSKHEVVKTAAAVSSSSSGMPVLTVSTAAPPLASPSFSVVSTVSTSRTSASLGSHTMAASITTTLSLSSSTSLTLSLSSLPSSSSVSLSSASLSSGLTTTTSLVTMAVTNPTVALLKSVNVGMSPDASCVNSASSKSPSKTVTLSTVCSDLKDGKSPKTKAAHNKKAKDNKIKPDMPVSVGSNLTPVGTSQTVVDGRTCVGMTIGTQPFSSPPPPSSHASLSGMVSCTLTSEPRPGDTVHVKKENPFHDPYEFNAKVEDKIELPPKKLKLEKADCIETAMSPQPQHPPSPSMLPPPLASPSQQQQQQQLQKRSIGVDVCSVGVVTEPECLGPCEPGTLVGLEGIVWKETDNGLLVVNVTWRGKTYVGTLMDATRYAWAPPRPNGCESPVSDFESRTPKGRGKRNCRTAAQSSERLPEGRRLRKGRRGTVNSSSSCFTAPPSPAKSDIGVNNMKRKTKANDNNSDKSKRSRSCSRGVNGAESPTPDDYIVCPEPNCHKKYKHMNGLRYHRTHAHRKSSLTDDAKDEEEGEDDDDEKPKKKEKTTSSERAERMKAKERQRMSELQRTSDRDSKDSLDDDIPLKEIANKVSGQSSAQKLDSANTDKEKVEDESRSSNNDISSSVAMATVNTASTTEASCAKQNTNLQNNPVPMSTDSAPQTKTKEINSMDVSSCTLAAVPSVSSPADSPHTIVAGDSSGQVPVPATTCVKSHVHQVSPTVTVATISRTSQADSPQGVMPTQALPVLTSATIQTTAATAVLAVTLSSDRQACPKGPGFLKTSSSVRPIVPAPLPQTSGIISSHSHSYTSQSSPHPHGIALKPIQPKPTIMGDYSVVSPALSDLSREKSRKLKKKKEKDQIGSVTGQQKSGLKVQTLPRESILEATTQDMYKVDRSAVIRNSIPSKPFDTCSPTSEISRSPFHPCVDSPSLHSNYPDTTLATGPPRLVIPPSSLAVSSNMDTKSTISEDVHSPAYSDISDANDSSSPVQHDSPKKDPSLKLDDHLNGPPHLTADGHPLSQHYGNIFYYGGPPNYLPHGINPQMASPTLSKGAIKSEYIDDNRPSSSENPQDKKEESDLQQKQLINYYAHIHNMSPAAVQYQLNITGFNPAPLDPPYTVLAQQTFAAEQKRLLQDGSIKLENASGRVAGTLSSKHPMGSDFELSRKSKSGLDLLDGSFDHKDDRGQSQRDKNSENLKENMELKSLMGLHHQIGPPASDQQNYQFLKQQNDLRAHMYQQQKQKVLESQRQEKRKGPPELTSGGHTTAIQSSGVSARHLPDNTNPDVHSDTVRKDMYPNRMDSKLDIADSKRFDIKEEKVLSKTATQDVSRSRPASQTSAHNIPAVSTISSAPQSLQSPLTSLPMSLVTPLPAAAGAAFTYPAYYPPFRPVQLDGMYRTINSHIIGYASPTPGYIHPAQLGYRMPAVDADRKSMDTSESPRGDAPGMATAAAYPPVHKIHELHDKGRPSPGVHSPASTKAGGGDHVNSPGPAISTPASEKVKEKQREYSSSPPTQRHVHTHHHTHVVGGFPPLYTPDAYSAMFGHPAAAAAAAIQTTSHAFPPHSPAASKP